MERNLDKLVQFLSFREATPLFFSLGFICKIIR